jgi:hypothetical protein
VARGAALIITTQVRMMKTGETHIVDSVALGRLAYTAMFEGMDEIPLPSAMQRPERALKPWTQGRMGIPDEQGAWEAFIERHPLADYRPARRRHEGSGSAHHESMRLWIAYPRVAYG